ncbi:MAG: DUF1667 domain-containing protein [Acidaminobacteraceae bacterium]
MKIGEKKEMICIVCPIGCRMTLECMKEHKTEDAYSVTGNKCKRGFDYAVKEMTSPMRMLPTTVKIEMGILNRLPVRTQNPIPKELIFDCMDVINNIKVYAPISMGDVVSSNILGTGVDVIATRSMDRSK